MNLDKIKKFVDGTIDAAEDPHIQHNDIVVFGSYLKGILILLEEVLKRLPDDEVDTTELEEIKIKGKTYKEWMDSQ